MTGINGLLFYDPADVPRNRWFIDTLCQTAEPEGISLRLCLSGADFPADAKPRFVLNRSRNAEISAYCEDVLHISVYNSAAVTRITNDKYRTHCFLRAHGLPTAETVLLRQGDGIPDIPLPAVAKPTDGHGGQGVTWIPDKAALDAYCASAPRPFLLQQPMVTGWDMRVYVLGGAVYAAMLRTSACDFRSNFSLGGQVRAVTPDAEALALVQRVQAVLPLDFAGVDLLRHPGGGYVIGEIEDAVGCRMLYAETQLDPVRDYIRCIAAQIRKG